MYRPLILRSDEGVLIPLAKPEVLVGRRLGCDIVIQYPTVSVHHFRINCVASNGYWYVEDLRSKNGTFVNRQRVNVERLIPGDELRIGKKYKYRVVSQGA